MPLIVPLYVSASLRLNCRAALSTIDALVIEPELPPLPIARVPLLIVVTPE